MKNDLRRNAFEFESRFGRLHEEVFKAIKEIYPPLRELHQAVLSYLSPVEWSGEASKDEKLQIVSEKAKTFDKLYQQRRILLPKHLYTRLDDFRDAVMQATNNFTFGRRREESGKSMKDEADAWGQAIQAVSDRINPLFEAMHDELQTILGFSHYVAPIQETAGDAGFRPHSHHRAQ